MKEFGVRLNPLPAALLLAGLCTSHADAQVAASAQIPEVVVSAQRTLAPASKTPLALSVVSGEDLQQAGLTRVSDLAARLPNVHLDGAADGLRITIRGVSSADNTDKGDPSAAFMVDGVYIARPQGQDAALFDIDRVEVLRGPQGTLYGRNTTAGAVNVITNPPSARLEAAAGVEAGSHGSRRVDGMVNLPAGPALALRAAVAVERRDSLLENGQGTGYTLGLDRDQRAARLSARLQAGPQASVLLRYDRSVNHDNPDSTVPDTNFYSAIETGSPQWHDAPTGRRLANAFVPPFGGQEQGRSRRDNSGLSAELAWDLGPATLHYLGAHRTLDQAFLENFYYRIMPGFALGVKEDFSGHHSQDSHELRVSTRADARVSAQAGLYWFREESQQTYAFRGLVPVGLPPYYVFPTGPTAARSRAVFGQATWNVLPALRATAGLRATTDEKSRVGSTNFQQGPSFNPATDLRLLNAASLSTHKTTWRLAADYDLAPATMLYASVSTDYKAGGFNDGCAAGSGAFGLECPAALAVPAQTLFYQPETLTARELGLKSRFWDQRATLNAAVFDYRYTNLQLSGVAIVGGAPRFVTANAGQASVRGLEVDGAVRVTPRDRLSYAATLLDAHYTQYAPDGVHSWAGHKLDRAPASTFTLGYEHAFRLPGAVLAAGAESRTSAAYVIGVPSQLLEYRISRRTESDAHLGYQRDGAAWSLLARVRNLENKVQPLTIDSFGMVVPSAPRSWDLRLNWRL